MKWNEEESLISFVNIIPTFSIYGQDFHIL